MARIRTLASGIAAWIALAATASAAPVSWFDSQAALTAWYANQLNSAGSIYAPGSSATITNLPPNWYYRPQAVVPASAPAPVPTASAVAPVSAPVQRQAIPASAIAPIAASATPSLATFSAAAPAASTSNRADAFINLGPGPYAESSITTGDAQPWYMSPAATAAYGGTPTSAQQSSFDQDVLSKVQQTFALSGIDIKLTTDPSVSADHMMSVVSGASYGPNPDAIGITQVGDSGFSFIDKLNYASNPDQLAWAVAHNVAHELMHAVGVGSHPDTTGDYIDAASADWKLLTDPKTSFSPAAVSLIKSAMANGADVGTLGAEILKSGVLSAQCHCRFCDKVSGLEGEQVLATPVPEPATVAVWMAGLAGGLVLHRRNRRAA